ncbi:molybdopterin converting factor subunit 1 [Marinobacter halodurans]|uniref:Molybdopterin synthase sulfur carrier subunit n=1 Tax=Marinobacter halodurans TaxID=2528979 RepID=A0ABY1ZNR2_9GAMM|nr:molybdopterin converting factor subunit 1 [Marinobacter halodurans]TBW58198.1 molybdopterin converting factor subunit 1 [Marinobacter halodurans]
MSAVVTVKFFARLRETLQTDELELPIGEQATVAEVIDTLARRGAPWDVLKGEQPVMIAVNQTMARPAHTLEPGDEIALFPPVTGG